MAAKIGYKMFRIEINKKSKYKNIKIGYSDVSLKVINLYNIFINLFYPMSQILC